MGPGERVDAIVEMNQPGIWILGATMDAARNAGMGVLVEYANQHKQLEWVAPPEIRLGLYDLRKGRLATVARSDD